MLSFPRRLLSAARSGSHAGYWLFTGHVVTIFGIALSNALMGLMGIWALVHRRRLDWRFSPYAGLFFPVSIFSILFLVSSLQSLDPTISLPGLKDLLSMLTLILAPFLVVGEAEVRRAFDLILGMIVLTALAGIGQYYFGPYGDLHQRIIGPFSHYQTFAGILLIGALTLIARLSTGDGWRRPINWLALGIILWTLLLTLTRGAWVAAAASLLVLALGRTRRAVLGGIVLMTLIAALLAPPSWTQRLTSIVDLSDPSNYDRLCMLDAGLYMVSERPLFGIGPDMVEVRYPIYRHPTAPRITVPHLHNSFIQRAAEQGLLGFIAYLGMMAAALVMAARGLRREGAEGSKADLYLAAVLVIVGFNVASLFEDNWNDTEVRRLLLFFLATPLCLRAAELGTGSETSSEIPASSTPVAALPPETHD